MLQASIRDFQLRPFQRDALQALQRHEHLICVAPTGAGKSLIYEEFSRTHRVLLVTPLTALARQQHARLLDQGIHSALAAGPDPSPPPDSRSGVWIVSPERLAFPRTIEKLRNWNPSLMAVDECHCIWDWGETFRPSFQKIPDVLRKLNDPRSLWLTATLPREAREELKRALPKPPVEIGEFALPSTLHLTVKRVPLSERASFVLDFVFKQSSPGIVFVHTRGGAERFANLLQASGKRCAIYHAGMANEERRITEKKIEDREPEIVVATSAFGMGMDHPHLRWAMITQSPPSILSLAQALGRAGRNPNITSTGVVLWDPDDFQRMRWMTQGSERRLRDLAEVGEFLSHENCRRASLENCFAARKRNALIRCNLCDFCS